jgi:replicative DNA helicase
LEVPQYDFYKLFKASYLGIEDTILRSGSLKYLDYNTQKKLMEIKFDPSLLMIECNNSLMIGEILGRIKRYSKLGAKVVFIDFMQRIRYDIKNSVNELENISKQLADISRELNIALVLLCQLNNLAERDIPSISHLKGSGGMAEAADTIFIFDNIYRRTGNEREKNIIDVEITQRYGESGKIKMYADLGKCKFSDYAFPDIEKIPKSYDGVLKSFHEPEMEESTF